MTDHLIQRRAPANALAEFAERPAEEYRGEVTPYYPSPLPETPRNALYRAVAQVGLGNNVAAGLPELVRLIDEIKPQEAEFYMVLGDGWKSEGKTEEAARHTGRLCNSKPDSARAMRALAERGRVACRTDSRAGGSDCAERRGIVVSIWSADIFGGEDSEGDCARSLAARSIAQAGGNDPLEASR